MVKKGESTARLLWVLAGIILFGCGIALSNWFMFVGGMFLLCLTASVTFPDEVED